MVSRIFVPCRWLALISALAVSFAFFAVVPARQSFASVESHTDISRSICDHDDAQSADDASISDAMPSEFGEGHRAELIEESEEEWYDSFPDDVIAIRYAPVMPSKCRASLVDAHFHLRFVSLPLRC